MHRRETKVLYSFKCKCGKKFDDFVKKWEDINKVRCSCGKKAIRVFTAPDVITDKGFPLTGTFDKRLGCKIEGREHFKQKVAEKGYMELSNADIKRMD